MNEILVTMTIELEQEMYDQASELFRSLGTTIEDTHTRATVFSAICAFSFLSRGVVVAELSPSYC